MLKSQSPESESAALKPKPELVAVRLTPATRAAIEAHQAVLAANMAGAKVSMMQAILHLVQLGLAATAQPSDA